MTKGECILLAIGAAILAYVVGLKVGADAAHTTRDNAANLNV